MGRPKAFLLLCRNRNAVIGIAIFFMFLICAVFAHFLSPFDPNDQGLPRRLQPPGWVNEEGNVHLLGTDALGRDVLSRVIHGSRISLIVGLASVGGSGTLGILLGLTAGFWGGILDRIIMRLVDIQLALPFIIISLVIVAILGASIQNIVFIFTVTSWVAYARMVRGSVLSVRETDFVLAARCIGVGRFHMLFHHILPNVLTPVIVLASFETARMILSESALSFLGLSVPPPAVTWGGMLAEGREYLRDAWWIATFPGLAIMVTVLGINFIGDGLRDAFDYRSRQYLGA
jgi:peptide/nickel transport system permease protein